MGRPRPKLRVQLVEDSLDDAFLLERELAGLGYDLAVDRVETSAAMARALDGGAYELVISDYSLPPRPYKDAWPAGRVNEHPRSLRGSHFEPQAVDKFKAPRLLAGQEAA